MKRLVAAAVVMAIIGFVNPVIAAGPVGTWKWTNPFGNQPRENTLKLRLDSEGPTLVGVYFDGLSNQEIPIAPARFNDEDGKISFSATCDLNGQKFTVRHSGRLQDDTIIGTSQFEVGGQVRSTDWVAKRHK